MAEGEPAAGGGTQEACAAACDCFCLPKPFLFPDRVSTLQGEYAVAASGEVAAGPVLHPADLVARDVGYGIDTAPQHVVSLEHLRRDATLPESVPVESVLDASRQPLVPVPVEGITPLVPVEVLGAEAVTPVELPQGGTAGAVTEAEAEHALPTLPDLPSRSVPAGGRTATRRAEGEIDAGPSGPPRGAMAAFMEPGRIVTGELRSGPDDPLFPVPGADPEAPPPPEGEEEEEDGQPAAPPASPGSGSGGSTPSGEEEEGGGGGGGRRFTPPDLGRAPPAPERPEAPGIQRPLAPPQHALGPGDAAPATLAPSLHPSAPAGSRVLVPGGMVAPTPPPPKPVGGILVPGGLAAPQLQTPPTTGTRQRFGSRALPFAAPPATAPLAPDPRQLPPPVTPPALSLPPLESEKGRQSSTTAFTESLTAGARAREAIEPGPAGGPRERVRPAPAKTPAQLPAHLLRRADASAKPVGRYVSPQTYAAAAVLLPQDADRTVDQPETLPEPRRDLEPRLVAPEHGAVSGSFPAEPTLPAVAAPATISDDHLASMTAPLVTGATVVPDGSFGSVGGAATPASTPPPQVAGGSRSQPSFRGKPSGKINQFAQAYAQADRAQDEAKAIRQRAEPYEQQAEAAREAARQHKAVHDAERAKHVKKLSYDAAAMNQAAKAWGEKSAAAYEAEKAAAELERAASTQDAIAAEAGGRADVLLGGILEENPQTGAELAVAAGKRARALDMAASPRTPSRYEQQKEVRARATGIYKESQLDKKRKRKLSPEKYKQWRSEQDAIEAARDAPVRTRLQDKQTENAEAKDEIRSLRAKGKLDSTEKARLRELQATEKRTRLSSQDRQALRKLKERNLDRGDREKSRHSDSRATARAEQAELDRKQRKALPPKQYEAWRAEQDRKEAADDAAVSQALERRKNLHSIALQDIAELEKKKPLSDEDAGKLEALKDETRELALTPDELEEFNEDIPKRDEDRAAREEERTELKGPVGPPGTQGAPGDGGGPEAAPVALVPVDSTVLDSQARSPDPCSGCTCNPPCKPGEVCICIPITGPTVPADTQPPNGVPGAGPSGGSPQIPEGVFLSPDRDSAPPPPPPGGSEETTPAHVAPADGEPSSSVPAPSVPARRARVAETAEDCPCELAQDGLELLAKLRESLDIIEEGVRSLRRHLDRTGWGGCLGSSASVEYECDRISRRVNQFLELARARADKLEFWLREIYCHHCDERMLVYISLDALEILTGALLAKVYVRAAQGTLWEKGTLTSPSDCPAYREALERAEPILDEVIRRMRVREAATTPWVNRPHELKEFIEWLALEGCSLASRFQAMSDVHSRATEGMTIADPDHSDEPPGFMDWYTAGQDLLLALAAIGGAGGGRGRTRGRRGRRTRDLWRRYGPERLRRAAIDEWGRGGRLEDRVRRTVDRVLGQLRTRGGGRSGRDTGSKRSPPRRRIPLRDRRRPEDWPADEAADRVRESSGHGGHGPQRHEGQVTSAQHDRRALYGELPDTGKVELWKKGKKAGTPKIPKQGSSSFRSNEAYAQAEMKARETASFKTGAANNQSRIEVKDLALEDALGPGYRRHVEGRTTLGAPSGTTRATDFSGGSVTAYYKRNSSGGYDLITLYPEGR